MRNKHTYLLLILAFTFFISGGAALLYQVIWQRLLGLFSGSDVRSVTIVVSAFLAGLGLGSLIGGLLADRLSSRRAIRLFGYCNLGIAAFALLSRWLFYDLLFLRLAEWASSTAFLLLIAFISLLWPTLLMGMSLPLLSKAVVRDIAQAAGRISLLDGLNTVGAGIGAMGTGWYLAGTFGYEVTLWLGAALSGLVGLVALLIAGQFAADDGVQATAVSVSFSLRQVPGDVWYWSLLTFVSGFMAISLELIWFRVLDVSLKSNAYTFAYLLAIFLFGDGLGTLIAIRFLPYTRQPRRIFLWIVSFVSLYSLAAVWGITWLARHYPPFTRYVTQSEGLVWFREAQLETLLIYLVFPLILMLLPTILFGFYFPVVQKAVQQEYAVLGQRVGLIKLANIVGNAAGGVVTGLVFLHYFGTSGSLQIIGALGLFFALLLFVQHGRQMRRPVQWAAGGMGAALLLGTLLFPRSEKLWADLHGAQPEDLFLVAEDSTGVAALRQSPGGPAIVFANGQSQATIPFLSGHGLLGALPALVHPQPQRVLIIGIGSAGTPYAAGVSSLTQEITAVEIIGAELAMLQQYRDLPGGEPVAHFFADARYEIVIGDGRRVLNLAERPFDIIQADAIRPTGSHSGLLYSREFFTAVSRQLAPGGIMSQWRPTERVEATFVSVFPYVVKVGNFVLLGSNDPIPYDAEEVLARLLSPEVEAYMRRGSYNVHEISPWIQAPPVFWTPETPRPNHSINTDLHPRDEYYLNGR